MTMTLSELVAILELDDIVSVPTSIADFEIINVKDFCRCAQRNYLKSSTFIKDIINILNELLNVLDINLISLDAFALMFKKVDDKDLHLELTHNCY